MKKGIKKYIDNIKRQGEGGFKGGSPPLPWVLIFFYLSIYLLRLDVIMSEDNLVRISSYELGSVEDWIRLYSYKNKFLKDRGFKEVDPFTFYRDLFPEGSYFLKVAYRKREST